MKENMYLSPLEVAQTAVNVGEKRSKNSIVNMFVLGLLAGMFIALAAEGSSMAAFNLLSKPETFGLGRLVAGTVFPVGMIFVLIAGAELFTGNNLIIMSVLEKKASLKGMLTNWFFVYIGNFVGSMIIVYFMSKSGLFHSGSDLLGGVTIRIASVKVEFTFIQAVILGIMCNLLVCLAIWMSFGAKDITGKMLSGFFPVWLFVTSGFEHSIANMYYVPAGILAKENPALAAASGLSAERLSNLNWSSFFTNNLIPVTIGNLIGGTVFVGLIYWFLHLRKKPV